MNQRRRARILPSAFRLFLMHLPFRFGRPGGPGFAPGLRASLAWTRRVLWHALFDHERFKYRLVRLRQRLPRR
ncbi:MULTISPECIES: hypothetical protein [Thauera]|jgi:hypothetical protein|uniref:hypothetical protein n=1 Tax=Thauera TaxID=33057 RepID=UPI0008386E01|nr:hypothetical protein [Thauera butanivorans]